MFRLLSFLGIPLVVLVAILSFCLGSGMSPRKLVRLLWVIALEAALLIGASWEVSRLHYPVIDYSPEYSVDELVGLWESRVGTLSLNANGTFQSSTGKQGPWYLEGPARYDVQIGDERWCAFRMDGQLQLLRPEDCEADADNWLLSRRFSRRPP